jgi:hypothetical protein
VHLIVLGVHQDRAAVTAQKINCVRAGDENGRRIDCMFETSGFHYPQFLRWIFHGVPIC